MLLPARSRDQQDDEGECPACASRQGRVRSGGRDEPVILCEQCGTTFYKRPIKQKHDYGTYYPYLDGYDDREYLAQLDLRRSRFLSQLREIEGLNPPGRRLVDFGAGPGYFCAIAREAGWDAAGIDSSHVAADAGSTAFQVPFVSLEDLEDGSCSVITAFHVIEHLDDPAAILRKLHGKLKPGGILVVHVPNRESLSSLIGFWCKRMLGRPVTRSGCLYYPEHLTGFTESGLIACASRARFAAVRMRECSLFSRHYDSWLIPTYLSGLKRRPLMGAWRLSRLMLSGLIDLIGEPIGRGDWLVAHFRSQ
ncbi:class I SAM-dependent methyltransferase [Reyranella sp.]|uniref:class I SAM-dependent methyltransferase n=1 Tax=Reyranella sp. TaxID=1929291 RepID=UPI003BAA14A9